MLYDEPECGRLRRALNQSEQTPRIASPNFLETAIVIDSKRTVDGSRALDDLLAEFKIEVVPFTAEHARMAREAYRDYGRGSGHPAKLNFGDSIAYALARSERQPLLYVGNDFVHTDIEAA